MEKLIEGVGINDAGYPTQLNEKFESPTGELRRRVLWRCPYYTKWTDMIRRCYSDKRQEKQPTYKGCTVCEDWIRFSNFRSWMETQDWEGKHLDKDLLNYGNKLYSPENCRFIPPLVNKFIKESRETRGKLPIGVCWHERDGKFVSQCSNPFNGKVEFLGYFSTPDDAHLAWLKRKLILATEISLQIDDKDVAKALVNRYENYVEFRY